MSTDEKVTIEFEGNASVGIFGKMEVPKELWEAYNSEENWDALEEYIQDRLDGPNFDSAAPYNIEFDDIKKT